MRRKEFQILPVWKFRDYMVNLEFREQNTDPPVGQGKPPCAELLVWEIRHEFGNLQRLSSAKEKRKTKKKN